jgi:outer membrane receptor protein involved in Fe transport
LTQYIGPDFSSLTEYFGLGNSQAYFGVPDFVVKGVPYSGYAWNNALTEEKALFGEATIKVIGKLSAIVGVRAAHLAITSQAQEFAGPVDGTAYTAQTFPDDVEHPITPRFGLTYQFNDDDMVYATAAKGYRTGGGNSLAVINDAGCEKNAQQLYGQSIPEFFSSDRLWSYEVGTKGSFLERRLAVQTSLYYIKWDGLQAGRTLPCGQSYTANAGDVISKGFDLQFAAILAEGLKLNVTAGFTKTYYPTSQYGAAGSNGSPPPLVYAAGDEIGGPPRLASAALDYARDVSRVWNRTRGYIRLDDRWVGRGVSQDPRTVGYDPVTACCVSPSYNILNVRLGLLHDKWDLSLFVDNAASANPRLGFADVAPKDPDLVFGNAIRPRTIGFTVSARY